MGKRNCAWTPHKPEYDYQIFVCGSWKHDSEDKSGASAYGILDKSGEFAIRSKGGIQNTTNIRCHLLAIWSGLTNVTDNSRVVVTTSDDIVIRTLSDDNINNDSNKDLKQHIISEIQRLKSFDIRFPKTSTDKSYLSEVSEAVKKSRREHGHSI
jgi:ribonuclease HI